MSYAGYKHQKGEKVIAIIDNHGYVFAPVPVAPVNETDRVLLPKSLQALKQVAKEVGLDVRGAYLNLDGGFDSAHNRKCICNASSFPILPQGEQFPRVICFLALLCSHYKICLY
jgi:hypothetical protein